MEVPVAAQNYAGKIFGQKGLDESTAAYAASLALSVFGRKVEELENVKKDLGEYMDRHGISFNPKEDYTMNDIGSNPVGNFNDPAMAAGKLA